MNQMNRALGEIISRRRQERNLSQEELAARAGIHRTYVSQIERGLKSPTLLILINLAQALDTKASVILSELEREADGVHS
jgi:transcriptional regulator with XRE-family HTH domain